MKRRASVVAVFSAIVIALYFLFHHGNPEAVPPVIPEGSASKTFAPVKGSGPSATQTQSSNINSTSPDIHAADAGQLVTPSEVATNIPPEPLLENVRRAIRQYGEMFGGNPVGNNAEITAALNGKNPKHAQFVNPEAGMQMNASGELIDSWGTPYFFHQLSATDMEIHSAGPDRQMWTADDIVVR